MYWSRTGSLLDVLIFGAVCAGWALGGWWLAALSGRFRRSENLVAGLASGLLLYILSSNLLAHFLPAYPAFTVSGVLILALGGWAALRSDRSRFRPRSDLKAWPQFLALLGMAILFALLMRGLGIGDDYAHLPLVSLMATGDIPPHYSLRPDVLLPYHYGLDLFAAGMVRVGGFFPWSAWDLTRALAISLTLCTIWLWLRRITRSRRAAWLGSILAAFGMGTRWILALLPISWVANLSSNIQLVGSSLATGDSLVQALYRSWIIEGGPPVAIPYAFANGILNPLTFDWAGASSLPFLALALILMLAGRRSLKPGAILLLAAAFLSLALSAEHIFVLLDLGAALAAWTMLLRKRLPFWQRLSSFPGQLFLVALGVALISLFQGGVITEIARTILTGSQGVGAAASGSFSLHWPPAFYDSHLGSLSVLNWRQLAVLLAECGPILLLFPLIIDRTRHDLRHQRLLEFGLATAAFLGVLIPLVVNYGVTRDITRFTGFGLEVWLLLAIQPLWAWFRRAALGKRILAGLVYAATILGGVALFLYQATAIPSPQVSSFISSMDSRMSRIYWDRLEPHTMVFDSTGYRSQTLFGRLSIDAINGFHFPQYVPYLPAPDPHRLHRLGFGYIYLDKRYWDRLSPAYQQVLYSSCTRVLQRLEKSNSATGELVDFRVLIDITACD